MSSVTPAGGNAVWHREQVSEVAAALGDVAAAHHITLDPSLEVVCERVAGRGGDKSPEWLATHVEWMRGHYAEGWTHLIDNSTMTPEESLAVVVTAVDNGAARFSP